MVEIKLRLESNNKITILETHDLVPNVQTIVTVEVANTKINRLEMTFVKTGFEPTAALQANPIGNNTFQLDITDIITYCNGSLFSMTMRAYESGNFVAQNGTEGLIFNVLKNGNKIIELISLDNLQRLYDLVAETFNLAFMALPKDFTKIPIGVQMSPAGMIAVMQENGTTAHFTLKELADIIKITDYDDELEYLSQLATADKTKSYLVKYDDTDPNNIKNYWKVMFFSKTSNQWITVAEGFVTQDDLSPLKANINEIKTKTDHIGYDINEPALVLNEDLVAGVDKTIGKANRRISKVYTKDIDNSGDIKTGSLTATSITLGTQSLTNVLNAINSKLVEIDGLFKIKDNQITTINGTLTSHTKSIDIALDSIQTLTLGLAALTSPTDPMDSIIKRRNIYSVKATGSGNTYSVDYINTMLDTKLETVEFKDTANGTLVKAKTIKSGPNITFTQGETVDEVIINSKGGGGGSTDLIAQASVQLDANVVLSNGVRTHIPLRIIQTSDSAIINGNANKNITFTSQAVGFFNLITGVARYLISAGGGSADTSIYLYYNVNGVDVWSVDTLRLTKGEMDAIELTSFLHNILQSGTYELALYAVFSTTTTGQTMTIYEDGSTAVVNMTSQKVIDLNNYADKVSYFNHVINALGNREIGRNTTSASDAIFAWNAGTTNNFKTWVATKPTKLEQALHVVVDEMIGDLDLVTDVNGNKVTISSAIKNLVVNALYANFTLKDLQQRKLTKADTQIASLGRSQMIRDVDNYEMVLRNKHGDTALPIRGRDTYQNGSVLETPGIYNATFSIGVSELVVAFDDFIGDDPTYSQDGHALKVNKDVTDNIQVSIEVLTNTVPGTDLKIVLQKNGVDVNTITATLGDNNVIELLKYHMNQNDKFEVKLRRTDTTTIKSVTLGSATLLAQGIQIKPPAIPISDIAIKLSTDDETKFVFFDLNRSKWVNEKGEAVVFGPDLVNLVKQLTDGDVVVAKSIHTENLISPDEKVYVEVTNEGRLKIGNEVEDYFAKEGDLKDGKLLVKTSLQAVLLTNGYDDNGNPKQMAYLDRTGTISIADAITGVVKDVLDTSRLETFGAENSEIEFSTTIFDNMTRDINEGVFKVMSARVISYYNPRRFRLVFYFDNPNDVLVARQYYLRIKSTQSDEETELYFGDATLENNTQLVFEMNTPDVTGHLNGMQDFTIFTAGRDFSKILTWNALKHKAETGELVVARALLADAANVLVDQNDDKDFIQNLDGTLIRKDGTVAAIGSKTYIDNKLPITNAIECEFEQLIDGTISEEEKEADENLFVVSGLPMAISPNGRYGVDVTNDGKVTVSDYDTGTVSELGYGVYTYVNHTASGSTLRYTKVGNIVYVIVTIPTSLWSWGEIFMLPQGFRPPEPLLSTRVVALSTTAMQHVSAVAISTNGKIHADAKFSAGDVFGFTFSYIAAS